MSRKSVAPNIAFDDQKNRYYVTLHYGVDRRGNRVKKTRCFPTLDQAILVRDNFLTAREIRGSILPSGVTVGKWLDYWLNDVIRPARAVTTVYGYQKIIDNHIKPILGRVLLQALTAVQVQQYLNRKQREGLSPNTIRKHYILLHSAVGLAVKQDMLGKNVVQSVTPPPERAPQHCFYSPEQIHQLFSLTAGRSLEPVVKLAGYLGMRRSEICGLKWENVDLEAGVLYICEARTAANGVAVDKGPKSPSSVRRLGFGGNADLRGLLGAMYETYLRDRGKYGEAFNPQGFVVTHGRGKPYAPDYLSGRFARVIREGGLPHCTLHGLRHSFASIANSQRVSMYSICKALGHSNTTITSRVYMHLFDDTHQDVVDLVGQAIASQS